MQKTKKKLSKTWISLIIAVAVVLSLIGGFFLIGAINKNPQQKVFDDYISAAKKQDVYKLAETMFAKGSEQYNDWVSKYISGKTAFEDFVEQNSSTDNGETIYTSDYYDFLSTRLTSAEYNSNDGFNPTDEKDYGLLLWVESRIASLIQSYEFKLSRSENHYAEYSISLVWPDSNYFNPSDYPSKYSSYISDDELGKSYEIGFKMEGKNWYFVSPFTFLLRSDAVDTWYAPYNANGVELKHVNPKDIENGTYTVGLTEEGQSIVSIGNNAFADCGTTLRKVILSPEVVNIGEYAFLNCKDLTSVSFSDEPQQTKETDAERNLIVGEGAFMNCESLTNFTLPKVNKVVPSYIFAGSGISNFEIFDTVTSIGHGAFMNCESLTRINIGESIKVIGDSAFDGAKNLTQINPSNTFSENLIKVGANAFKGCEKLTTIHFSSGLRILESGTFSNCTNLSTITLPDTLKTIGQYAFTSTGLTVVNVPQSVENVGIYAFSNCSNLTNFVWSEQPRIKAIGTSAFSGCVSLYEFTIPQTVTQLGQTAFAGCSALRLVRVNTSGNISLGKNAFDVHDGIPKLYVADDTTFKNNANWFGLEIYSQDIVVDNDYAIIEQTEVDVNGVVSNEKILIQYIGDSATVDLTPLGITRIGGGAFSYNTRVTSITFDSTKLNRIGGNAFEGCNDSIFTKFTSDRANATLLYIGDWLIKSEKKFESTGVLDLSQSNSLLFRDSNGNTTLPQTKGIAGFAFERANASQIILPSTLKYLGESSFAYSTNIKSVIFDGQSVLSRIEADSFLSCDRLTSFSVPNTVTFIGMQAFDSCTNLRYVTIESDKIMLENNVFRSLHDILKIYIDGYDSSSFYKNDASWANYSDITFDKGIISGDYAIKDSALIQYLGLTDNKTPVDLGNFEITKIEKGAFATSDIYEVIIPSYIERIENYAFYNCKLLTIVTFEADSEGKSDLMHLGDYAFSGCTEIRGVDGKVVMEADSANTNFTTGRNVFDDNVSRKIMVDVRANYTFEGSGWSSYRDAIRAGDDPTVIIKIEVIGGSVAANNRVNTSNEPTREYEALPATVLDFIAYADTDYEFVGWFVDGELEQEDSTLKVTFGESRQDNPPTYTARFRYVG